MNSNNQISYLDYNSTTPIDPRVLEAMLPFLKDNFANPSSTHHFGQSINEKVKQARERIADFINAEPNELIFTSGATEAINCCQRYCRKLLKQGKTHNHGFIRTQGGFRHL